LGTCLKYVVIIIINTSELFPENAKQKEVDKTFIVSDYLPNLCIGLSK